MLKVEENEVLIRQLMIENSDLRGKLFIPKVNHNYDNYKKYIFYSIPRCVVKSVMNTCMALDIFSRKIQKEIKKDCLIVFLGQGPKIYKLVFELMIKKHPNPTPSITLRGSLKDDSILDLESSIMKYFIKKFQYVGNKPHVIFVDYVASGSSLQKLGSALSNNSPWPTTNFSHSYFCLGNKNESKIIKLKNNYDVIRPIEEA